MAAQATRATTELDRAGVHYLTHSYRVDEKVGEGYGPAVAAAIGMPPERVFKTLVAEVDGETVVAVLPVRRRLSVRKLARSAGGKKATLMSPAMAERETGYLPGGISPFGRRIVAERAHDRVSAFSGGMKRRLNLAASLLHDPDILLLDEPTVGVDPQSRLAIFENLEALKARGKALLYTTHYMEEVERLADRVVVVDHGRVVASDTLDGLQRHAPDGSGRASLETIFLRAVNEDAQAAGARDGEGKP